MPDSGEVVRDDVGAGRGVSCVNVDHGDDGGCRAAHALAPMLLWSPSCLGGGIGSSLGSGASRAH